MKRLRSILGYSGAILTVALAAITPFVLYGWFQNAIGGLGLKVHPEFSGGEVGHTITRPGYRMLVYRKVERATRWQRVDPFVQIEWTPASGLPAQVSEDVDLDGDGAADVRVAFRPAELVVDAAPLHAPYRASHSRGVTSFSLLIARVDDRILVRLPVE